MKIRVFGSGCAACRTMNRNVDQAIQELGIEVDVERVTRVLEMIEHGVTGTPALKIDDEIKVVGRALDVASIKDLLASASTKREI